MVSSLFHYKECEALQKHDVQMIVSCSLGNTMIIGSKHLFKLIRFKVRMAQTNIVIGTLV